MAGTSKGAKKAVDTRKKHDPQSFQKMGAKGGSTGGSTRSSSSSKKR